MGARMIHCYSFWGRQSVPRAGHLGIGSALTAKCPLPRFVAWRPLWMFGGRMMHYPYACRPRSCSCATPMRSVFSRLSSSASDFWRSRLQQAQRCPGGHRHRHRLHFRAEQRLCITRPAKEQRLAWPLKGTLQTATTAVTSSHRGLASLSGPTPRPAWSLFVGLTIQAQVRRKSGVRLTCRLILNSAIVLVMQSFAAATGRSLHQETLLPLVLEPLMQPVMVPVLGRCAPLSLVAFGSDGWMAQYCFIARATYTELVMRTRAA
mmetsp:Transcript_9668/g.18576  ORF Transcript_9668/g.18576 Transcript_9668/m.18576 type:complete len:263 (-) Transcript_9668:1129-1917(-)